MPGPLIPGDLERIAEHQGVELTDEWIEDHFQASEGATMRVRETQQTIKIPTCTPAQKPDGSCIFLDNDNRCTIHAVAPFGCSHFSVCSKSLTQSDVERSQSMGMVQYQDHANKGALSQAIEKLAEAGVVASPTKERRDNFEKELAEVERRMQLKKQKRMRKQLKAKKRKKR